MNAVSRAKVNLFELPPTFRSEKYDDFINWDNPQHTGYWESIKTARVLRIVGPGRCVVLFAYDQHIPDGARGTSWVTRQENYRMLYLNTKGDLVEFDPAEVRAEANISSWDKGVTQWLEANGAMTFKGRGWAESLEMRVKNLIARWEKHYSKNLRPLSE